MTKLSSLLNQLRALRLGRPQFEGFVHKRTVHYMAGWARNRARPSERVTVEAVLSAPDGERVLARAVADVYYGLLSLQSGDDVRHGFQLYFDPPLSASESDCVIVRPAGTVTPLEFAEPPEPPPGINVEAAQLPALQGYVDELSVTGLSGWMMSPRDSASRLDFEVVIALPGETRVIASGVANQPYEPLAVSGFDETDYGFRIEFPVKLTALERDHVIVRAKGHHDILARASEFQGFVDELSTRHVAGWVRSRFRPEIQLDVEAILTGPHSEAKLAAGVAGRMHAGLALGAPEDGYHGFRLEFADELSRDQLGAVSVRLAAAEFIVPSALPPGAAPEYQGYVDELSAHHVAGWVRIPFQPETPLNVEAVLRGPDGEQRLATGKADAFHLGLAAGAPDDGNHGFHLRFASPLASQQLSAVLVRVAASDFTLPRSFLVDAAPAALQPTEPAPPELAAPAAIPPARHFFGFIDDLSLSHASGWIIDVNDRSLRIDFEAVLVLDSQTRIIARGMADQVYPPLQGGGFGDASYGFEVQFPALTAEERNSLIIRPVGSDFSLPRASGLQGGVDERSCHHAGGWARDRFHPEDTLIVEAVLPDAKGGRIVASAPAGRRHPGLALAAPDDADHGFRIIFAAPLTEAERDVLIMRVAGAEDPLPVSENLVTGFDSVVQGFIDDYSASYIAGWMRDPQEPDAALEFEVAVLLPRETRILATGFANQPYQPLADAGAANPNHGFRVEFAGPLSIDERDHLTVRTRDSHIALGFGTRFEGFVDQRSTRHIAGWVRNRFRPEDQLAVEILASGPAGEFRLAEIPANAFNRGISQTAPQDAYHGFRFVFETKIRPEQRDELTVRVVGAGYTLPLSPELSTDFEPLTDLGLPQDDGASAFQAFAEAGYEFAVDAVTKFYNTLRIFGWFHHPTDHLISVRVIGDAQYASIPSLGLDHEGVLATHGPGKGFSLQVLRHQESFNEAAELEFTTARGWTGRANLKALCKARLQPRFYKTSMMLHHFLDTMDLEGARILDIGGRSRSSNDFSLLFKQADCVVFDIMPGENVDVVGDAHEMTRLFPAESFDAIYSVSTFEHLLMPWAVAVQMNHVLKPGGQALIFSHQTLGIHDPPWDFWRFSDTAWDALFNPQTGFEILDRAMSFEEHILPFIWRPNKPNEERAVGFEGSAVLIRKTGPSAMSWNLTPADLTKTMYPG
jgi:hypothetical protein